MISTRSSGWLPAAASFLITLFIFLTEGTGAERGKFGDYTKLMIESCHDPTGQVAFLGHFPNPYNCSTFFVCYETSRGSTEALELNCPHFINGGGEMELLVWNFEKCYCDFPWNIPCYNPYNDDHQKHRFDCITILTKGIPGREKDRDRRN